MVQILESQDPPWNLEELSLKDQHPGYGALGLSALRQTEPASWACCPLPSQDTVMAVSRDCCGLNVEHTPPLSQPLSPPQMQVCTLVPSRC